MSNLTDKLISLLRYELCETKCDFDAGEPLSEEEIKKLCEISNGHDVLHLAADALIKNGIAAPALEGKLKKSVLLANFRCEQIEHEFDRLCEKFEEQKIPFLPLKGAVIRPLYPEKWMRMSCDIDILIKPEDIERAGEHLVNDMNYTEGEKGPHDISYYAPGGVHLELHFDTVEGGRASLAKNVLDKVWDASYSQDGSYHYCMTDEMYYFYHIAHMAKHLEEGGCGIRPFMDTFILENRVEHSDEKRDSLLEEGGLLRFADSVRELTEVWFGDKEHTDVTRAFEQFILTGGNFGTVKNRVMVRQARSSGKLGYYLSRFILPYDRMKAIFPVLEKHKSLLPFFHIYRLIKQIKKNGTARYVDELKTSGSSDIDGGGITSLLDEIGL